VLDDAPARHVGSEAAGFVRMVFSLHDPTTIERLFREAGFDAVTVAPIPNRCGGPRTPAAVHPRPTQPRCVGIFYT
jgi:hypothetical protein